MNKEQHALDMWAKIEGNEIDEYWYCPKCRERVEPSHVTYEETHDIDLCQSIVFWNDHPAIDHPFLHEIIKGLDSESGGLECEYYRYRTYLRVIVYNDLNKQGIDMVNSATGEKYIGIATVDNILEALFEVDF